MKDLWNHRNNGRDIIEIKAMMKMKIPEEPFAFEACFVVLQEFGSFK